MMARREIEFEFGQARRPHARHRTRVAGIEAQELAMTRSNPYDVGLDRNPANFVALSPLSFIERTASVFPDRVALIYGTLRQSWSQTYRRCRRLGSALAARGIGRGDTVAAMLPNVPAMFEAHFGVAMSGAVLNTLNTRLDAEAIAFMLQHGGARVLLTDREFSPVVEKALALLEGERPLVVEVQDPQAPAGRELGEIDYESLLASGDPDFAWQLPADEWEAITLNYTSGTTGNPKGVVYHHRGAYLNAVSNVISWGMPEHSVYLWTLPMFHCNGWCFPWTLAVNAGTSVCLRKVDPAQVFALIREHAVTHLCGAPIVYSMLINAPDDWRAGIRHAIKGLIAGAAPPAAVIEGCERIGIDITHVYGLTESYGPAAVCAKQQSWEALPLEERARLNGRQGVAYHLQQAIAVLDPNTMKPVPPDGETMGEIFFRGNIVMKGYLKNPGATAEVFSGGWFHTGDLAVVHPDGYVKIKDRSKDVIISGGENISSLEVEDALHRHPAVLAAAVVAQPDPKWGEVPCAFVELKPGASPAPEELIEHCRTLLARFKVPKRIVFGPLPKTSTGKIQKFVLRQQVKSASAIE
jgi:fatty-acyl-CoA synthase